MIWSIAWRNVWRNKLRSFIILCAVAIGLFGTLFIIALDKGMVVQREEAAINTEISHIQIHNPLFLQDNSIKYDIPDATAKVKDIEKVVGVKAVTARLVVTAMASTATTGTGVTIIGINPDMEKKVTKLHEDVIEGSYFDKESRTPQIVVGEKLATKLGARLGSKIVLTLTNTQGVLTYALFRVGGIYKTSNTMYNEANAFVRTSDLAPLLGFNTENATEIAVLLDNTGETDRITDLLKNEFKDLSVQSWKTIQPMLVTLSAIMDEFSYLMMIIILIAMAFGIINTMLMAILERVREIGMLMAVGMNRRRVAIMITLETVFLSVTGAVIGMAVSYVTIRLTGTHGLNFAAVAQGFEAYGYSALIYPMLNRLDYIVLFVLVIITALVSSVYPVHKALRFKPAEAIRTDT